MKPTSKLIIYSFLFLTTSIFAQLGGKIYSAEEADNIYGKVDYSVNLSASQIVKILDKTNNVIMFKFVNNDLLILGDGRKTLYAKKFTPLTKSEKLSAFKKSTFVEFLNKSEDDLVRVELRGKVLTLTKGAYTLEYSMPCPPYCD